MRRSALHRKRIADIQRERIVAAMVETAAEHGAPNVSVAQIVAVSGVSRRTFYELFEDREECFLVAFEQVLAHARERTLEACRGNEHWRERVRAGLIALLELCEQEPAATRLLAVESASAGPRVLERRREVLAELSAVLEQGRAQARAGAAELSQLAAEGLLGGVLAVLAERMLRDDGTAFLELASPLMSMIVLPYLGVAAARRELSRPAPRRARQPSPSAADPFKDFPMRLTYRTIRVLMEVGENPGASNRRIGNAAGMTDQGQISKLLHRLERLGLIENRDRDRVRGEANAWALTSRGHALEQRVRPHSGTSANVESQRLAEPSKGRYIP